MDKILEEVAEPLGGGLQVEYTTAGGLFLTFHDQTKASKLVQDILYAYELQHMLDVLDGACSRWGMTINVEKTKVLTVGDHLGAADQTPITLQNCTLEDMTTFSYQGSQVQQTGGGTGYKDRESWDSVPDSETKSLSELQPQ